MFTNKKVSSINGRRLHICSSQESKIKDKMHDFNYENNNVYEKNVKKINIYQPRAHFIIIYNSSSVYSLYQ